MNTTAIVHKTLLEYSLRVILAHILCGIYIQGTLQIFYIYHKFYRIYNENLHQRHFLQ